MKNKKIENYIFGIYKDLTGHDLRTRTLYFKSHRWATGNRGFVRRAFKKLYNEYIEYDGDFERRLTQIAYRINLEEERNLATMEVLSGCPVAWDNYQVLRWTSKISKAVLNRFSNNG